MRIGRKEKNNVKNTLEDTSSLDNIESLKNWIRKLEQTTGSVSARLCAVEKRFSQGIPMNDNDKVFVESPKKNKSGCFIHVPGKSQKQGETKNHYFDEITLLREEIITYRQDTKVFHETVCTLQENTNLTSEEIHQLQSLITSQINDVHHRLTVIEQRTPMMMRLGTFTIPIEVTGLIGGILTFFIAFLVITNRKDIIVSPFFLGMIGSILISSALLKTVRNRFRRNHDRSFIPTSTSKSNMSALDLLKYK